MKSHLVGIVKENTSTSTSNFKTILIGMISLIALAFIVNKNKKKLIPLTLLTSSCASSTLPYALRPENFTPEEIETLKASAQEWSEKSNGKYQIVIDENCPADVCSVIKKVPYIKEQPKASGVCLAYNIDYDINIPGNCEEGGPYDKYEIDLADDSNDWYDFSPTVLHEMGHILGKKDTDNPDMIMSATSTKGQGPQHLTQADIDE